MKRRNEEGEEGVGWKNSQGATQISFPKQNVWFLFQLHPFALCSHLRVKPTVRSGANFLLCIKMHWLLKNEVGYMGLWCTHQHSINQTATETLEKVQSKQTGLSHDSHGIAGPHRSQPSRRDQTTKSLWIFYRVHYVDKGNVVHTPGAAALQQHRQITTRLKADPLQVCCFAKLAICQDEE